ncbi:Protein deglycase DJ-1zDJ-1 [Smittium mucronatum]|uniref:D-lactate dehydratase n=1 Tax=Smittium mucronatum TaxID=133383 RepID=A0A1R0GLX4_9FUNG|nr:Protein deglycase DJ-1zDJ-1 [Smittium mucronatum]
MSKVNRAVIFIADGTEEIEATVTVDVLRRAGIEVLVCGVSIEKVPYYTCSRGLKIVPDSILDFDPINFDTFNAVIIPGGLEGSKILSENDQVQRILADFYAQGKVVATICAGCLAIKTAKLFNKKGVKLSITGHPSVKNQLKDDFDFLSDRVVSDNHLITASGPGASFEFAFEIVKRMTGIENARAVAAPMLLNFVVDE